MTKAELRVLERIFSAEIDAALSKQPIRGIWQTRGTKLMRKLKDEGFVQDVELTLGGQFPVKVRGWNLTMAGHLAYCLSCDESEPQAGRE